MSFAKFIFKSAFRKKSRVIFTLLGISIPIIIILFYGLSMGTVVNSDNGVNYDITFYGNTTDFYSSGEHSQTEEYEGMDENLIDKLKNVNGVEEVMGTYTTILNSSNFNFTNIDAMYIHGFKKSDQKFMGLKIISGRIFEDDEKELILPNKALIKLNKKVGESISLDNETYKIVGIIEKDDSSTYVNYITGYTSIKNARNMNALKNNERLDFNNGKIKDIDVKISTGYNVSEVAEKMEKEYGKEIGHANIIGKNNDTMSKIEFYIFQLIPEFIAIIITFIFTIKSVHDRTREIGVLKAIGWKSKRIFTMILSETLILSICSFIIGSIIICTIFYMIQSNMVGFKLDLIIFLQLLDINIFVYTFLMITIIALLAGLFPAIRASRLSPTEAVREE
ncbi:MAG: FtsX-like permease family protein [Methanobrevibacter sp. CfCl-M3]